MTAKQVFEYSLVELNKREAPSLLLEDYNYFINKAVNQYINKIYNAYDVNQQKTDDLRVLKSTAVLVPSISTEYTADSLFNVTYDVDLPDDYLHVLNCVVEYDVLQNYKCYNSGTKWQQGARRLTADMFSQIINNYYLRPTYKSPYYYINNVTTDFIYPTDENVLLVGTGIQVPKYVISVTSANVTTDSKVNIITHDGVVTTVTCTALDTATDIAGDITSALTALTSAVSVVGTTVTILDSAISNIYLSGPGLVLSKTPSSSRVAENRYGNRSKVRMEIRYGKDNSTFRLSKVYIDYLKAPQFIRLTQEQVDEVVDNSQILEFPDYVAQEIVNELIKLLMENASDPRLQTHMPINQSIANPVQEQPQQKR